MALPLGYNLRSVAARWASTVVAVLGIAGTVAVFVAVLALARGFQATLVASGSPRNAIVMRAGATSEMVSAITQERVRVIEDAPGVARRGAEPLVSPEIVVIAALPLRETRTDANVQMRGVAPRVLAVRENVRIVRGRMFQPGLPELVVGRNAVVAYLGLELGQRLKLGGAEWEIVGVFDAGGSAFDSELWGDSRVVAQTYRRPLDLAQTVTVRLDAPEALQAFKETLGRDPRLTVQVQGEVEFYEKQSEMVTRLITVLGALVAAVMGIGAVFGALNTMYSAVAERGREIAVLRALGFGGGAIVLSFLVEALLIAFLGGVLGCLVVLPLDGLAAGTMNWQTFAHMAFAFRITPGQLAAGVAFALLMGVLGGLPPAIRAARRPVAASLRAL